MLHCFASHGHNYFLCFEDNTVYISSLNYLWQLQIFITIISPLWFPAFSFILTLFKIFSHASPLNILSFLSTTFLMISAFFSTVKLINNEDDQVKEKVKEGKEEGFFNKLEFKVYWELLHGHTFYQALYVHYYISSYSVLCSFPLKQFMAVKKSSILTRDLQPPGFPWNLVGTWWEKPALWIPLMLLLQKTLCCFLPGHVSTRQTLLIPARGLVLGSTEERKPV